MLIQVTENPQEAQETLRGEITKSEWRHSFKIACDAINDIWFDIYLYTERNADGELIAIGTAEVDGQGFLEILNLATKHYRRGSGARAVREFKAMARRLNTEITLMAAVEVVEFWQRVGFEVDDYFYGNKSDGVLMWQE